MEAHQNEFRNELLIHTTWRVCKCRLLAVLAALTSLASQAASNLLLDPSFEAVGGVPTNNYLVFTGSLGDGWTVTAGVILIENGTVNGIPHSGNQLAYLDGNFTFNTLSQTIATAPGQQYTVSLWVADTSANTLQVTFAGQTLFSGTAPASGGGNPATHYVDEVFTVAASSTSSTLSISGQYTAGGSGTVLDDVSIVAVPEPVPATLLGGGFLGLFLIRQRLLPWRRGRIRG
jgi:hypothetical protein